MTTDIGQLLLQTLDPKCQKDAEAKLSGLEGQPGFGFGLLNYVSTQESSVRMAAAVYFKNFIKKYWAENKLSAQDKNDIKNNIVQIMISVDQSCQLQISDAVIQIANVDFPNDWGNLVPDLISRLNLQDFKINIGVLTTAHAIFKRWRHQFRSDKLFLEIKQVLALFAEPFLRFLQETDKLIDATNDPVRLGLLFQTLFLLNKIFYSLNAQDLPEFFEDHMEEFMVIFQKYLLYSNPALITQDLDEAGWLEKVKASICEIIDLYATKYEEDFKRLPQFVEIVWNLLTNIGLEPKNDFLVSKAISFLTSVVKPARHRDMFANPDALRSICSRVIVSNMTLRDSDVELFEDEPIEYIRRDLEGSDSDTRRRAASDLVRGLLEHFAKDVTEICSQYANEYLETYNQDRVNNWKAKDAALYLISSLSAKALTVQFGATQVNEYMDVLPIFGNHALPDLQLPVDGAIHPILKVDAIKYLLLFRSQLTKEQLMEILPLLITHLGSTNYVVHTYAAVCLERIFAIKSGTEFIFDSSNIAAFAPQLLNRLFELIEANSSPNKLGENDYLMKAIMRVVLVLRQDISPLVEENLGRLTKIITVISKNPLNPKFNHYAFETLALFVRFSCMTNVSLVSSFETYLFPPFQELIDQKSEDFAPYAFQIMTQLLTYHTEAGIPEQYAQMIPKFLGPSYWDSSGNRPALVRFMQAFLSKGPNEIVARGHLQPFLGVCHKLIASKLDDVYGFELIISIIENIPIQALSPYIKNIFVLLLTRLTSSKTSQFSHAFIRFMCTLFVIQKPGLTVDDIIGTLDSIQSTPLFNGLLSGVLIPELKNIYTNDDLNLCLAGMAHLLTKSQIMLSPPYLSMWPSILESLISLINHPLPPASAPAEEGEFAEIDDGGYKVAYSRLSTLGPVKKNVYLLVTNDSKMYLATSLAQFGKSPSGGSVQALIQQQLSNISAFERESSSKASVTLLSVKYASPTDEFYYDLYSKIWCTYRHSFPALGSFTSDAGFGCMLRCGQMMLSNTMMLYAEGREWRISESAAYYETLKLFLDSFTCPFSLHRIALAGQQFGKEIGSWFGPQTIANVLNMLIKDYKSNLCIYTAENGVIYKDSLLESFKENDAQACLCLIPLRLGVERLNPVYYSSLLKCFDVEYCVGIAGGRPNSALYFIGCQENSLVYLDPHVTRETIQLKDSYTMQELQSYHTTSFKTLSISSVDPSLLIGFLIKSVKDINLFINSIQGLISGKTPIFTVEDTLPDFEKGANSAEILSDDDMD